MNSSVSHNDFEENAEMHMKEYNTGEMTKEKETSQEFWHVNHRRHVHAYVFRS